MGEGINNDGGSAEYRGDAPCSLARAVGVVGERWTFFILREALVGAKRFTEFRQRLGVAPDVLSARLATLVGSGLMLRREYREPGSRARDDYQLTEAGRQMAMVISALQQWGDVWTPSQTPTSVAFRDSRGRDLRAAFVDTDGHRVPAEDVVPVRVWEP